VQRLLDATSYAVYVFSTDTLALLHVNDGASRQTGYSVDELATMSPMHILPRLPERRLQALLEPLVSGKVSTLSFETEVRRADGTETPVEMIVELIAPEPEVPAVYVAVGRDISERLATQRVLAETQHRLAVSEDRERIARDLHDKVIQRLFATGLSLQAIAGQASDAVRDRMQLAVDELDHAIRDIRPVIFSLHTSPQSTADGLRSRILEKTAEASRLLGFTPSLHFAGAIDTARDPDLVDAVLASTQEALSNIVRHAQATRVDIELIVDDTELRLIIRDDGVGIPSDASQRGGLGIASIRERAATVGGRAHFGPAEPSGTELTWTAPLR
jgi:PAS domain S-box-containing protein